MRKELLTLMMIPLLLAVFTLQATARGFNNSDFKGKFDYSFEGDFTQEINPSLPLEGTVQEVGVFRADGRGNITGNARSLVSGAAQIGGTYVGTYTVNPMGFIDVSVDRFDGVNPDPLITDLKFVMILRNKNDDEGKTIRFFIRADEPTTTINILGSGASQHGPS